MEIARRTYLFVAALFVFLVAGLPTEAEAQGEGLTCGWCIVRIDVVVDPGRIIVFPLRHKFPGGGNECGWNGHDDYGATCSRCGRTSSCHTGSQWGPCHIACGPGGDDPGDDEEVAAALTEVEDALGSGDVAAVASALLDPSPGFSFEFTPEAGRIDFFLACDPDRAYRTIPVAPRVRDRLTAALRSSERTE